MNSSSYIHVVLHQALFTVGIADSPSKVGSLHGEMEECLSGSSDDVNAKHAVRLLFD